MNYLKLNTSFFFQDINISSKKDNNESVEDCKDNEDEEK